MRRLALGVVLVAVLAEAPASSSRSHLSATNGWIAFASDRVGLGAQGFGLFRLDPAGGKVTRLGTLRGRWPAWSPDGSRIAYVDDRERLVVANAEGRGARVVTSHLLDVAMPAWSPDGSRIVFAQDDDFASSPYGLTVITADGRKTKRLTRARDAYPAWSPDGSLVAFSRGARGTAEETIYVIRSDGRGLRALTDGRVHEFDAAWSPDGSLIAFTHQPEPDPPFATEIWTMRLDGSEQRRLQPASDQFGDHSPSWSPDGSWLVYAGSESTRRGAKLVIVRADGTDKTDLTAGSPADDLDPAWQPVCSHAGTPRRETLRGSAADDRVCGYGGDDSISAGTGRDGLYGGGGNDVLRSVDGVFDVVGCGAGADVVLADRGDLVGVDCERVRRR